MERLKANKLNRQVLDKNNLSNEKAASRATDLDTDDQEQLSESAVAVDSTPPDLAKSAQRLSNMPNSGARQQIFRTLATHYGNGYANKLNTVMRDTAKTEPPDELDTLLNLNSHTAHYNDQQLQDARQLAEAETDPAKKAKLFKLLQQKTTYYNQNENQSKAFNNATHKTWNLGIGMCNVTSLSMALEGVGVTFSQAKTAFPDTFEKYKATIMAEESLSMADRQTWAASVAEATRFPDFLEQLRMVHHFHWLTQPDTWRELAKLFGVSLSYIAQDEGKHPKQWWLENVQTAFESGDSVVVGVDNHVIRLQEVNDGGLVLDDPNAYTNLGKGMATHSGGHIDFSWDYSKSGNDTFVPWDVAEKYNFRWVYKLKGASAVPGRAAAKPKQTGAAPAPASAQGPAAAQAGAAPAKAKAEQHGPLNAEEEQTALAAMKRAMVDGMGKNKVIDQGYFAIRGEGKINPSDKKAVAEWTYIQDHLLRSALTSLPFYLLTGN